LILSDSVIDAMCSVDGSLRSEVYTYVSVKVYGVWGHNTT